MAITQMQLIQSLGEAMAWLERELTWDVPVAELRHLNGRIGELYVALITNGQMATNVNQKGYDVISQDGEKISVKTTTMKGGSGHVSFNPNTLNQVDRIFILRIDTVEMQIETLLDLPLEQAEKLMTGKTAQGKRDISLSKLTKKSKPTNDIVKVKSASYLGTVINELETGTIEVFIDDKLITALPELRKIAAKINVSILNRAGNPYNTRQLGSVVIKALTSR